MTEYIWKSVKSKETFFSSDLLLNSFGYWKVRSIREIFDYVINLYCKKTVETERIAVPLTALKEIYVIQSKLLSLSKNEQLLVKPRRSGNGSIFEVLIWKPNTTEILLEDNVWTLTKTNVE